MKKAIQTLSGLSPSTGFLLFVTTQNIWTEEKHLNVDALVGVFFHISDLRYKLSPNVMFMILT